MKSTSTNSHRSNRFHLFILAVFIVVSSASSARAQMSYVYDELGRVIAVTDPSGDTVRYTYDAVGNVLSISRASSATLSFISFNPKSGPIGTTVTIFGTAFSTTPANNTVTFNGQAATVTSSTATQIVTTVPSGATTGVIQVTTAAGSVSSSTSFTVTSSSAPTISSLSPTIGTTGTSLTVTGTNFQTTASHNKTKVNITNATVSSATSTSISTTVPTVSSSGKVSVTTPGGTAVSSDDFFIPPSSYSASDVAVTGRMTAGNSQTVTLSTAGKIGMILFEGSPGQRVSIKPTSCTFTSVRLTILEPNGVALSAATMITTGGFMDTPILKASGTHTIVVDPDLSYTGAITFTLYVFNDVTGSITAGGSSVTATTTTPGQRAFYSFSGTANQRVSLKMTSGSYTGGSINGANVYVRKLQGPLLGDVLIATTGFIDATTLLTTGSYVIEVDPSTAATGSVTLTLYDVPADTTGTITAGGSAVSVSTSTPGQNDLRTFSGTASQRISLKMSSGSWSNGSPSSAHVDIKKPDGTELADVLLAPNGFIDIQTLPTTGTYTIVTDPDNSSTGSVTLTLYDVDADVTGTITPGGSAVTVTTTDPGQNGEHTFSGTANQKVSLKVTGGSFSGGSINGAHVRIKRANGTQLDSALVVTTGFIDTITLPATETYTVLTDPLTASTGSLTLTLYDVVDATGSVTHGGSAVTVTLSTPGQNGSLTFSGTASTQATVQITNNTTGACVAVVLKKPDGSTLTSTSSCAANFNLSQQTLPSTGTYTITINPSGSGTGSLDVRVTNP